MRCLKPITITKNVLEPTEVPCGKCIPCRVNLRNSWALRLEWEALAHPTCLFVGLSYDDDNVPFVRGSGHLTLRREDYVHYFERLRYQLKKLHNATFRYYIIGEYGATTYRPHYHIQFFSHAPLGHPSCLYAQDQDSSYCLNVCALDCVVKCIRSAWPYGHVTSYPTTPEDIRYITLLHVTGLKPPFPDCEPAFTSSSRRPGIGDSYFTLSNLPADHWQKGNPFFTYTPDGVLTPQARYYRDRIFSEPERKYFFHDIPDEPSALVKSQAFANSWMFNSWRSKGKM